MSAAGGTPKPIAGVGFALYPEWLPDGRSIIFTTGRDVQDARAFATIGIDGGSPKVLAQLTDSSLSGPPVLGTGGDLQQAQFVEPGYLVFGQSPGAVRALPIDPQSFVGDRTADPACRQHRARRRRRAGCTLPHRATDGWCRRLRVSDTSWSGSIVQDASRPCPAIEWHTAVLKSRPTARPSRSPPTTTRADRTSGSMTPRAATEVV